MLRDITIGQHFPGDSLVHRFDPRLKLVLTILIHQWVITMLRPMRS